MVRLRVLVAALAMAGVVLTTAAAPAAPPARQGLEAAFKGLAIGRGRLKSQIVGLDRGFLVWTRGHERGDLFVLDQLFRFDDGSSDRRTWRFHRTGPGRYVGERQDLASPATLVIAGGTIRLSYDIWLRRHGLPALRLHCEDRIVRLASGALLSKGVIYSLGVPVGSVETHLIPDAGSASLPRRP